jgi:hypothetical protein
MALPAPHAMNVEPYTKDFLVCPAMFLDIIKNIAVLMAEKDCMRIKAIKRPMRVDSDGATVHRTIVPVALMKV